MHGVKINSVRPSDFLSFLGKLKQKGKTIDEAKQIKDKEIADALELPSIKLHCSVLAEEGIKKAIEDWENKESHRKHNQ